MTDATITTLAGSVLAAIPATILAWATLVQSKKNAEKADVIGAKTDEIHVLANSNLAAVNRALEVANTKIEGLNKLVTAMAENKTDVAKALATPPPVSGRPNEV